MNEDKKIREVNRSVSGDIKIGFFPFHQVLIVTISILLVFIAKEIFKFSLMSAAISAGILAGVGILAVGERPWLFFNRFIRAPGTVLRGGVMYNKFLK